MKIVGEEREWESERGRKRENRENKEKKEVVIKEHKFQRSLVIRIVAGI